MNTPLKNPLKLLFICTHNRCRSILCEAIANQDHAGILLARSAGSSPSGQVHPMTLKHLLHSNYHVNNLSSQSWDEHQIFQADIVLTVCDTAGGESCPVWFGDAIQGHWGLPDPSKLTDEAHSDKAFIDVIQTIKQQMKSLAELAKFHDQQPLTKSEMREALQNLGIGLKP